jgi:hypothetical protein
MVQNGKMNGNGNGTRLSHEPVRHRVWLGLSVAAMAFLGGWLGFLAGDRDIPTTTYSAQTLTPEVAPGGVFRVSYTMRRHRSCETHVDRFIYDSENTRHVLPPLDFNPGLRLGQDEYTVPVKVPEEAKRGPARYSVVSTYICNPLQKLWPIIGEQREIRFEIR